MRLTAVRRSATIASTLVLALTVTSLAGAPADAAARPHVDRGPAVQGRSASPIDRASEPASSKSAAVVAGAIPVAGKYTVAIPTQRAATTKLTQLDGKRFASVAGEWQELGGTGIQVAAAQTADAPVSAQTKGTLSHPVENVYAEVLDQREAHQHGLQGLVLKMARADQTKGSAPIAVRIPDTTLNSIYGADYASRIEWRQVDASAKSAKAAKPVPVARDGNGAVVLTPTISQSAIILTAAATPISATGTGAFTASSLKPSSAWDVSAQTGDFSWSYPLQVPPTPAGPAPQVAFSYDSQSVDGETGSTNNQTSPIGEGWSLAGAGFIERTYVSCATDNGASGPVTSSGDLCWKTDNATISFAGHSGQLIRDTASGAWRLQSDDGTRFEHLVGTAAGCASNGTYDTDCWRMTTTNGTRYFFGLNQLPGFAGGKPTTNSTWTVPVYGNDVGEPCHGATFAASSCTQAWRWNLDYVVDTHGNAEAFYYDAQTNSYATNGSAATSYVRGGELDHIDYGFTNGNAYASNAASGRVVFGYDSYGRCSDSTHANCTTEPISGNATAPAHPTYYPDVPFDQNCPSGSCSGLLSPTFWSTAMLTTVSTKALVAGAYANVDVWTLSHSFPDPGDTTSAALWLTKIDHTGYSGSSSLSEPSTVFSGVTMQNRVWVVDGLAPLDKYRISKIQTSLGAVISVFYSPQQCTPAGAAGIEAAPESNTNRCFPQWWSPKVTPPQPAQKDLFHKYVVTQVVSDPKTGGGNDAAQETDYVYTGTPAWRYDTSPLVPDDKKSWSVFAGYNTVEVRVGDPNAPTSQKTTDYTFFQGMDGDRASASGGAKSVSVTGTPGMADSLWYAGRTREAKTLNGVGGAIVSDVVTTPWSSPITANNGVNTARFTGDAEVLQTEPVSTGGNRTVRTSTTYDSSMGLPTQVNIVPSDAAATCTTTTYAAPNTSAGIIGSIAEVSKIGVACANVSAAHYPADAITDTRTSYDGLAVGAAPTKGDATKVEIVDGYPGGTAASAHWVTQTATAYDSLGRETSVTDILQHTTTTAYTPAASAAAGSGGTTQVVTTAPAPFSWSTTVTYDPARGTELTTTDQNNKLTTATYDPLGRRSAVWLPSQPKASNPNYPSIAYAYLLSQTAASAVTTKTITAGGVISTYVLYDGLGQQIQTQGPAEGGGTVVTDTAYDAHGRVAFTDGAYWTPSVNPSTTLFVPTALAQISSQTVTTYDAVDRPVKTTLNSIGSERFHTTIAYPGADRVDTTPPTGGTPTSTFTNSQGQQTRLVQYLAATPSSSATTETTRYAYNAQGKMTSMTDPALNNWSWSFDVLGHQIAANDPDSGTTTSSYDGAGNLLSTTDARNSTVSYTYDNLNRKPPNTRGRPGQERSLPPGPMTLLPRASRLARAPTWGRHLGPRDWRTQTPSPGTTTYTTSQTAPRPFPQAPRHSAALVTASTAATTSTGQP
ncbi:RHS repeat protein [Leifsonia sp. 21MFCrub1.1]|uniref:RHS repeat protein n=1 Tax=Leifsonia sp. 21MFCrub1.1 TaxID=1798223 RepID=UPI000B7FCC0F|nr:RHS repeat protein [Leifsonia sp. 21MFCrub1.1]